MIVALLLIYTHMVPVTFVLLLWLRSVPMLGPVTWIDVLKLAAMSLVWPVLPFPSLVEDL